jgi:hypothetical protein
MKMERWKRQFIKLLFHYSARRMRMEAADLVKQPHVPPALYKFRHFCKEHKEALEQGVLWRTPPALFNDPYDSIIYFDTRRFLMEDLSLEEFRKAVADLQAAVKFTPKPLEKPIRLSEWSAWMVREVLRDQPREIVEACLKGSEDFFRKIQETTVRQMSDTVRKGYSVISFAGNVTSVLMWSHYSSSHSGFCIEYNLTGSEWGRSCYPVLYRQKLINASRYMFKQDPMDFNNLFAIYASIIKGDEWKYEQEWRIVLPAGEPYSTGQLPMPKPSAIILGALVKSDDAEWMRRFCDSRSIPLRKMIQHQGEFRLEIEPASVRVR